MKKILFALLLLVLLFSGCSNLQGRTLQIAGQDQTSVWEPTTLSCSNTQNCIEASVAQGAKAEEVQDQIRCTNNMCEVKITREFING